MKLDKGLNKRVCVIVVFVCFSLLDSRLSELASLLVAQSELLSLIAGRVPRGRDFSLHVLINTLYEKG